MPDGPMPADPFTPEHVGAVAMLAFYRSLRAANGGVIEAAILVAASVAVQGHVTQNNPRSEGG